MSETELIEYAQNGDKKSLAELVKKYEKTVYNFAFKICRDPEKAENTMQDTFLSMVKSLHQFDNNSKLSTWLYRIVMNHCLMAHRKNKHNFVELDEEQSTSPSAWHLKNVSTEPERLLENTELKNVLDTAIKKLSEDYRIVFLLRDVEGLSTEETAKVTNLSVSAVKSRLHRARAFLRDEINKAYTK